MAHYMHEFIKISANRFFQKTFYLSSTSLQGLGSLYGRLLVPDFLVDMQPLVLSKDNVNIFVVPRATN